MQTGLGESRAIYSYRRIYNQRSPRECIQVDLARYLARIRPGRKRSGAANTKKSVIRCSGQQRPSAYAVFISIYLSLLEVEKLVVVIVACNDR